MEEDVPHHDRPDQRADVDVGGASAEHLRVAPRGRDEQHVEDERQRELVPDGLAERVVDQPADDERAGGDRDRDRDREVHHRLVDEIRVRAVPVDDREERHAGEPGGVGLPLGPVQVLAQRLADRAGAELLADVEAAAVHRPQLAEHAALRVRRVPRRLERHVEHHEVERGADPRDAGDEVQPADAEVQPVDDVTLHGLQASATSTVSPSRTVASLPRIALELPEHVDLRDEAALVAARHRRRAVGQGERRALHPEAHRARVDDLARIGLELHAHRQREVDLLAPGVGARLRRQRGHERLRGRRVVEDGDELALRPLHPDLRHRFGPSRSRKVRATTSVALYRSSRRRFSSARWPFASSSVRGPAPYSTVGMPASL